MPAITQNLILTLIKHELKYNKLVLGLSKIGLLADHYFPNLEPIIYDLIGFEDTTKDEKLYEIYDHFKNKIVILEINEFTTHLDHLALELYLELDSERKRRGLNQ